MKTLSFGPGPADRPGGLRRAWHEIERTWLGLVAPPLDARMAASGWTPDPPSAYCPRCAASVGPYEATGVDTRSPTGQPGCGACRGVKLHWERAVRLGEYDGLLRDLIHEVKFTRWRRLGDDLGRLLGERLVIELIAAGVDQGRVVLVPVPMTVRRRMARGIDHTLTLARGMARASGFPILEALSRSHRPSQLSVPASGRWRNVAGSIRLRHGVDLEGWTAVVIDDVKTTGATMAVACRAVAGVGDSGVRSKARNGSQVRVWSAVVSVARSPDRRRKAGTTGEREGADGEPGERGARADIFDR